MPIPAMSTGQRAALARRIAKPIANLERELLQRQPSVRAPRLLHVEPGVRLLRCRHDPPVRSCLPRRARRPNFGGTEVSSWPRDLSGFGRSGPQADGRAQAAHIAATFAGGRLQAVRSSHTTSTGTPASAHRGKPASARPGFPRGPVPGSASAAPELGEPVGRTALARDQIRRPVYSDVLGVGQTRCRLGAAATSGRTVVGERAAYRAKFSRSALTCPVDAGADGSGG